MIVTNIHGGFGNQLFTYAIGYILAQKNETELLLDTTLHHSGYFRPLEILNLKIPYRRELYIKYKHDLINRAVFNKIRKKNAFRKLTKFYEKETFRYDKDVLKIKDNTYLQGYWQCSKYYDEFRPDFQTIFEHNSSYTLGDKSLVYLKKIKKQESVAIHIRRGDYVNIGCAVNYQYYLNAIDIIKSSIEDPVFYFFSDDLTYIKDKILQRVEANCEIVDNNSNNSTIDDFILMKACKHQIISNSSYSWWAAYLNGYDKRTVIAPKLGKWGEEFYHNDWILLKAERMDAPR